MYYLADEIPPEQLTLDINEAHIVGVTYGGEFHYYVAPRLVWYLDLAKRFPLATKDPENPDFITHLSILIPDDDHAAEYIRRLEPYKRSNARLQKEMQECTDKFDLYEYYPQILIDFDKKHLVSYYPEPYFFEDYVPDGWTSEYGGIGCDPHYFLRDRDEVDDGLGIGGLAQDYIPMEHHFWIDENGKSIFKRMFKNFEKKENEK